MKALYYIGDNLSFVFEIYLATPTTFSGTVVWRSDLYYKTKAPTQGNVTVLRGDPAVKTSRNTLQHILDYHKVLNTVTAEITVTLIL